MMNTLDEFRTRTGLPLVTVMHPGHKDEDVIPLRDDVTSRGFAVYQSFDRAALALSRVVGYREWLVESA